MFGLFIFNGEVIASCTAIFSVQLWKIQKQGIVKGSENESWMHEKREEIVIVVLEVNSSINLNI